MHASSRSSTYYVFHDTAVPGADVPDGENSEAVFVLLDEMLSLLKVEEQEQEEGMVRGRRATKA